MRDSSKLSALVRDYVADSGNPDLSTYGRHFRNPDSRKTRLFPRKIAEMCRLVSASGGTLLDVGCGFGWNAIGFAVLGGCRRVIANDIRESMTAPLDEFLRRKRSEGVDLPITTMTGDICELDLAPGSIDSIICNQTIEHVHDLDGMFARCAQLLRVGGRAIFTNDNNLLCRRQLEEIRDMWRRRDSDWDYIEELKQQRPIENAGIEPYGVMRRRIAQAANPSLAAGELDRVVAATAGLREPEIAKIAADHRDGRVLPEPPTYSWCRNPVTGEYCERQLDPFAVAEQIRQAGFSVRVRHGFNRWPIRLLNDVPWRPLNMLLFQKNAHFTLVAVRS